MNLLGLTFDAIGAVLLICGELQSHAGLLNYWGTGDQKDNVLEQFNKFWWWKRWPLKLGVAWGRRHRMGQSSPIDSFPFTAWGIFLLLVGFLLQGIASLYGRCS